MIATGERVPKGFNVLIARLAVLQEARATRAVRSKRHFDVFINLSGLLFPIRLVSGFAPGLSMRHIRVLALAPERDGGRVVLILELMHPFCQPFDFLLQQADPPVLFDDDRNEHIRLLSQPLKLFAQDVLFHAHITKCLSPKVQVFFCKKYFSRCPLAH
jgi:hypothetical protein